MNYIKKRLNRNLFLLIIADGLIILTSIYISILFRFDFKVPVGLKNLLTYQNFIILIFLKIFCFRIFALYRGMWRYTSVWDMMNVIKANVLSTCILCLTLYFSIGFTNISRSLFAIDFIVCTGLISISRLGIRMFFTQVKNILSVNKINDNKKNIILVGAGDTGQLILRQVFQKNNSSIRILGIVDDDEYKIGHRLLGVPVLGKIKTLEKLKINFDEIFICVPSASNEQMRVIVNECKKTKKPFKTLPSIGELIEGKVSISQFREVSLLDLLGREEIILDKSTINNFIK